MSWLAAARLGDGNPMRESAGHQISAEPSDITGENLRWCQVIMDA
jgi:hypothetical protein